MNYIRRFTEVGIRDVGEVGGKNASLGEMTRTLSAKGIRVPGGFATSADAFWLFLSENQLQAPLQELMKKLDRVHFSNLHETGQAARELLLKARMPAILEKQITGEYESLSGGKAMEVAVRSSATAEDLPEASFAGQHESYLDIRGIANVLQAVKRCFASLYTDRAIKYREDNGFAHEKIALSVGIQKMVRSDLAGSGVIFTLEPESGFRDIVHIAAVWGLGENIVQGTVTPDEFLVFKPTLRKGRNGIVQKKLGEKEKTMTYGAEGEQEVINTDTPLEKREQFVLNDEEVSRLAGWAIEIEDHYGKPMDIEWAKDGVDGQLYIIQARPETVHSRKDPYLITQYKLKGKSEVLITGQAVGDRVVAGIARILQSPAEIDSLREGEVLVTDLTSPDWDPILKKAAAIITNKGGRTSHASIVARELGVPAIVGSGQATAVIADGEWITVSCSEGKIGRVYRGKMEVEESVRNFRNIKLPDEVEPMLIVGDPDQAFRLSFYPNKGVGLMRMEFIIMHYVQVHPMALIEFDHITDVELRKKIESITHHYPDKRLYFVDKLSQGIATIAAAFYPKEVIVRMSDFKTNEYANLVGGKLFEPGEENPMIGFRGASRYYSPAYQPGFELECQAIRKVRQEMGLDNVKVMIPFCRTPEEARKVLKVMKEAGLDRVLDRSLECYMMTEIPSNVLQAGEFAELFDGFSIGSNDLTQLTLGIDRDSALVADLFDERNASVKTLISMVIQVAREKKRKIGLCGQAPSDMPEFAQFLVQKGINSISFNADAVLKGIENIIQAEKKSTTQII